MDSLIVSEQVVRIIFCSSSIMRDIGGDCAAVQSLFCVCTVVIDVVLGLITGWGQKVGGLVHILPNSIKRIDGVELLELILLHVSKCVTQGIHERDARLPAWSTKRQPSDETSLHIPCLLAIPVRPMRTSTRSEIEAAKFSKPTQLTNREPFGHLRKTSSCNPSS